MKYYFAPVSHSVAFSCTIHAVLLKNFPVGSEMVQAGLFLTCMFALLACALPWAVVCASLVHSFWAVDVDIVYQCGLSAHIPFGT